VNIKLEQLQLKQEKCEEFIFNYRACYMLDKIRSRADAFEHAKL